MLMRFEWRQYGCFNRAAPIPGRLWMEVILNSPPRSPLQSCRPYSGAVIKLRGKGTNKRFLASIVPPLFRGGYVVRPRIARILEYASIVPPLFRGGYAIGFGRYRLQIPASIVPPLFRGGYSLPVAGFVVLYTIPAGLHPPSSLVSLSCPPIASPMTRPGYGILREVSLAGVATAPLASW